MSGSPIILGTGANGHLDVLWVDGERVFCRGWHRDAEGADHPRLAVLAATHLPAPGSADRLAHEFALRHYLDGSWALRPLELVREPGRTILILEWCDGQPLERLVGAPMQVAQFLRIAVGLSAALRRLDEAGLVHKDIKPSNVLVDAAAGKAWLTGFGIATCLPRERQSPDPPELIAGTLAYMAPEQTGRMNRSIDSRSDLYALGVTLYQMLTGCLPFTAADPMDWVHCHIARQPVPPHERVQDIPGPVSAIVMKLMAKTAEGRYQTAVGLERDLRRCLEAWAADGRIAAFALGLHDKPDRPRIPEKLYGRAAEISTLLASFERVKGGGRPELVLVSGYSGVGKSSVVNELHKSLVLPRGLFASGKFDQYKRDIPYATLAQAFQSLILPLLGRNEQELARWRDAIGEAVGPNAKLVVDLVPELKLVIGEQPAVPDLPRQDARNRLHLALRRFIGAFAREHPVALFLDDLQWLDAGTLDLMQDLLTDPDVNGVLLIGAYRDDEAGPTHPLLRKLNAMRQAGAIIHDIVLAPLTRDDLEQLIADSLACEPSHAASLAGLVDEKTGGNPFFAIQFVSSLFEQGLIIFDHVQGRWSWDLSRIHAEGYTDNVVDLLVEKLNRLPAATQRALQLLACLGSRADFEVLDAVCQDSSQEMHEHLWEAVRTGLIFRSDECYTFLHDRVQEAAYSLMAEALRAEAHLRTGMSMAANTAPDKLDERIFEIVNQLNRGTHLITSRADRERTAELNLIAGKRASNSTAYASALQYLHAGRGLLTEETWDRNYDLVFSIESRMAECELHTADMDAAEARLGRLAQRARSRHDLAVVTRLQVTLFTTLDRSDRAIDVFLEYLRTDGTDWSPHPAREDVIEEYDRIWSLVGSRQIEELLDLPLLVDADVLDMLDVFTEIVHPAMFFDENLSTLVVCRMVNLCLQHGNCDASCFGYVWFGMFAGPRFDNYRDGYRFGQLGYDLVESRNLIRYQARTFVSFATLTPWAKHATKGRELVQRAFEIAHRTGDLTFSAYSWHVLITNYLAVGDPLSQVQSEVEQGLAFVKKAGFGLVAENCGAQLGLVRSLRGLTSTFGCFDAHDYTEKDTERRLAANPMLALAEFFYWTRKLQARFFAGEYGWAVEASRKAHQLLWPAASQVETGDFRFFAALAHAAAWNSASSEERQRHSAALNDHHQQLETWALHCPANFETKAALVKAEIARIEGRMLEAEHLYEAAIRAADVNGFMHYEAVAQECAANFYAGRGLGRIARAYLRDARQCYVRWGADGKVRQLDQQRPEFFADERSLGSSSTMVTSAEQLDLATVIKVSQAVSGEIVLEKLVETLMRTAIVQAGAERGALVRAHGNAHRLVAQASIQGDTVFVHQCDEALTAAAVPASIIRFVARTAEPVLLDDASAPGSFAGDEYFRERQVRSVLCLPLVNQGELIGILYLENNLAPHVFTPARTAVLKLVSSQAAIALENASLYRDIAERESKIRRLVDANIIGTYMWKACGGNVEAGDVAIVDANDAFLRMIGYDREDLAAGLLSKSLLSPPEGRDRDADTAAEVNATGTVLPFEKEYLRKDGTRVPVLVGLAAFDERRLEGFAFVLDLTERRRAEADARENERRYREVQAALAHAGRVATMGQITASIAHEVSQPVAGAITNAHTALGWLGAPTPDMEEAKQALNRIIRDGNRARDVIERIRALARKAPGRRDPVELNGAVQEVVELTRNQATKNGISVRLEMMEGMLVVLGDRVQLQQVVLNLIVNAIESMNGVSDGPRDLVVTTVRQASGEVAVVVQDSGSGLTEQALGKLFDPFHTTKGDGLGLGLSICRSIIEAHGGRLWASANPPRGAIFQFAIPTA